MDRKTKHVIVDWATYEKVTEDAAGIETAGVGKTDFFA